MSGPYRWLAPASIGLATAFMALALFVVVQGNVGSLQAVPRDPELTVVHSVSGAPAVDVYLNDRKALSGITFRQSTDLTAVPAGEYTVKLFASCIEADATKCVDPIATQAKPLFESKLTLATGSATAVVAYGTPTAIKVLPVALELAPLSEATRNLPETARRQAEVLNDDTGLYVKAVNTTADPVSLLKLNLAMPFDLADEKDDKKTVKSFTRLYDQIPAESASPVSVLKSDTYDFAWFRGDQKLVSISDAEFEAKHYELLILTDEMPAGATASRPAYFRVEASRLRDPFGSPQAIGYAMLTRYLLPFELVSLLLLTAMVGAIVLAREEMVKRTRQRINVAAGAARINRAQSEIAGARSASQPGAQSSAD